MGYGLIGSEWANQIHSFYAEHLNPYLHFHRPGGFATIEVKERGKRRRRNKANGYRTPYEKLTTLTKWKSYLKSGVTARSLGQLAAQHSETEAATLRQEAKIILLAQARSARVAIAAPQVTTLLSGARRLKCRPLAPHPNPPLNKSDRKDNPAKRHTSL